MPILHPTTISQSAIIIIINIALPSQMLVSVRLTAAGLLQAGLQQQAAGAAWYATKAAAKTSSAKASDNLIPAKDWKAVKLPPQTADTVPVTKYPGQAFVGDLRCGGGVLQC